MPSSSVQPWEAAPSPQFALGFGQRDVEALLAGPRALHQELQRDRRLAGAGRAFDQKHCSL